MSPFITLNHVKYFINVRLLHVNVKVIVPDLVPPKVDPEATFNTKLPLVVDVAAVLVFTVIPVGNPVAATVQATFLFPTYPSKGIVIVNAADVFSSFPHAIESASFPQAMLVESSPLVPLYVIV